MELSIESVDSVLFNYSDIDALPASAQSNVRFGPQPPVLHGYMSMSLMNAKDHMDKGPAYVFHKEFDKLVILPEDSFHVSESQPQRRDDTAHQQSTNFTPAVYAPIGHKPWFCYWNGTLLEGFIFVNEVVSSNQTGALIKRGDPSVSIETSTASKFVTPSSSPTASFGGFTLFNRSLADWASTTGSYDDTATAADIPSPPPVSENYAPPSESLLAEDIYPAVIKIEERRNLEDGDQPYCQQMLIMEDGSVQSNDLPMISLSLDGIGEIVNRRSKKRGASSETRSNLGRRDGGACLCEWIVDGT